METLNVTDEPQRQRARGGGDQPARAYDPVEAALLSRQHLFPPIFYPLRYRFLCSYSFPPGFRSPFYKTDDLSGEGSNYWPIRHPDLFRVDQILCNRYNENDHAAYCEWVRTKIQPERVMEIQSKLLLSLIHI